ncbi:unnamed protein product [Peronospora belbahrii]|uniref:Uncharacterized protein n=1 Tax=Peronospora belbahrii TaxID=622444 RepID=A0AAU9KKK6_9STRA|nr:unnamed protein product [Peronospora belbahrii]CAH0515590.1 unnamed protein product [Peronospora belbahrii]
MSKKKLRKELKKRQQNTVDTSILSPNDKESRRSCKKHRTIKSSDDDIEKEVEIDTLNFDDAFAAGLAFEQLESYDGALISFQRAIECQPTHLGALMHLADVYSASGQLDEALSCYIKASEREHNKENASVWFRLGLAHAAMDQQLEATKAYHQSMNINARALESLNNGDEKTRELWEAYGVTLAALVEAFGELGDLNSAVKVFEDAVARFPESANMHYNLATMCMARNKSTGDDEFDSVVAQSLERAVKLSPETLEFVEDLALYLEAHNQQSHRVDELRRKADVLACTSRVTTATSDDENKQEQGSCNNMEEDVSEEEEDNEEDGEES